MLLFGRRQVTDVGEQVRDLLHRVETLERSLRELDLEQVTLHDHVRKWMRRAVAAERRLDAAAEPGVPPAQTALPLPAEPPHRLWGPRARRLARARELHNGSAEAAGSTEGEG